VSRRHNGEGSIYPVKGGYRGYVWCTNPAGERYRKYVKGKTYEATQQAWLKLRDEANRGPVASDVTTLEKFLSYWLKEIAQPNLAPKTFEKYELFTRLHIIPHLGCKRLDKLQVKDVRQWLNKLSRICQCCAQGKDAARPEAKRRCCSVGKCCQEVLSPGTRKDARNVLRAALTCAVEEQVIARNPAVFRLSGRRDPKPKRRSWTVDEARQFLESARRDDDVFYTAYVLVLVLGLRKGELLGLTWNMVDLDAGELYVSEQLQRVGRQLLRRETKTDTSEAPLPMPDVCITALKLRKQQQDADRDRADGAWISTGLAPAAHCSPLSTSTLALPCRSCGTARSPSPWRSTQRYPRPPPARPSRSSGSGSASEHHCCMQTRCCTLLLHQDQKRPVP
jgi:integrase